MISFNFIKYFGVFVFALVISSACRFWQKAGGETPSPTPFVAEELTSEIPFSTKEPEVFQVEILITAKNSEFKIFAARAGNRRRVDFNAGLKKQVTYIHTNKHYLIQQSRKIYVDDAELEEFGVSREWTEFLTTEWLNTKTDVKFFKLDAENNLIKYRVVFGDAENAKSESLIFIDEASGLPVRQEFYSIEGEQKILTMTVELKNLKLEAASDLFAIPAGYRKVSRAEFAGISRKEDE
jgi:hypothetical protein